MDKIPHEHWEAIRMMGDRVLRYCPRTGMKIWESSAWDSIRSDSHQISFRAGSDSIWIQGSPARVCGSGCAVFGEGAAVALDLVGCLDRMITFTSKQIGIELSRDYKHWHVSRIDVTSNLMLDDLAAVRIALRTLRECEGGRYRVSQQAGDTVYWSHKSRLRSGKAYAKGPHIDYMMKQPNYSGRIYSIEERNLSNRILRLELKLGAQYLRERTDKPWFELTRDDLTGEWRTYFERMIGASEMTDESQLIDRIIAVSDTPGKAKAAHSLFLLIQSQGWEKARDLTHKTTWYRNLKILHAAGLGDADISAGNVVQLRRKVLECSAVHSWAQIISLAA
ncbi:phage/plasmid replication protein, II/X family [Methylomonas sp. AM2-LC]|uniref:phage/plasmid replication protein, II/X family n=1 Tax=Methylomonas sp. AM2-LC TaxID=3153301 RepID=UPI003265D04C